ncbi:hypothetical protein E1B28_012101 [Marasmius oreades]|uniref:Uncharacterized protein n=1 Tax=Marasmius oreades TaxID=181124 RepID=A0A9P7UNK9_9AGAR|nr:uncharacterized protein E1B28_012101 [Marasmius oreades]KAG7088070.1 hypothetical protein E1B28_012101 [Marasmius oreades]
MASQSPISFGSLYLAGFLQAGSPPHVALIIPESEETGFMMHITIKPGVWTYETMNQRIRGSMTFTTLLKIHDVSAGAITKQELDDIRKEVPPPPGSDSGFCLSWTIEVVQRLHDRRLLSLSSAQNLKQEFSEFAAGNSKFARHNFLPNIAVSNYCAWQVLHVRDNLYF